MSAFYDNDITNDGRSLLAELHLGARFQPTKIVIGSGFLPEGKTTRTISAVVTPVIELPVAKAERVNKGTAVFGASFTNKDTTEDFFYRELALYAKGVYADGTETAEVLYSYGNAGKVAELIPAYQTANIVSKEIDLLVYIGNDTQVILQMSDGVYVGMKTFHRTVAALRAEIAACGGNITKTITIPVSAWRQREFDDTEQQTYADEYIYAADVVIDGCRETYFASVALDKASLVPAGNAGLCPTCQTLDGVVRFWAKKIPKMELTATVALIGESIRTDAGAGEISYAMPIATADRLGGVKVGDGLQITEDGILSAKDNFATSAETEALMDEIFEEEQSEE